MIIRTDQQIRMPSWASYYRAGATGNGGKGAISATQAGGGGGGAFSGTQTAPERAAPGSLINVRFESSAVIVEVLGYRLSAGHAANASGANGGAGGVAAGGAVNFNGGNGGTATNATGSCAGGGSAASRAGAGANAANSSTIPGPGADGTAGFSYFNGSAPGGQGFNTSATRQPQASPNQPTNGTLGASIIQISTAAVRCDGGDGGGGSGGVDTGSSSNVPGSGFAILEFW